MPTGLGAGFAVNHHDVGGKIDIINKKAAANSIDIGRDLGGLEIGDSFRGEIGHLHHGEFIVSRGGACLRQG